MKSVKIIFSSFLIVAALVTLSSFVASFDSKSFARVCYFYIKTKKRVQKGQTDSIVPSELTNVASWSSTGAATEPPTGCNNGAFFCAICFDNPPVTLQQAINILGTFYASNNLTHSTNIDPGSSNLTVYLKSTTP